MSQQTAVRSGTATSQSVPMAGVITNILHARDIRSFGYPTRTTNAPRWILGRVQTIVH